MGTDPVIGELQQVSKVCVVEGLLSSFKLVPECHTHPPWFLSVTHCMLEPRLPIARVITHRMQLRVTPVKSAGSQHFVPYADAPVSAMYRIWWVPQFGISDGIHWRSACFRAQGSAGGAVVSRAQLCVLARGGGPGAHGGDRRGPAQGSERQHSRVVGRLRGSKDAALQLRLLHRKPLLVLRRHG